MPCISTTAYFRHTQWFIESPRNFAKFFPALFIAEIRMCIYLFYLTHCLFRIMVNTIYSLKSTPTFRCTYLSFVKTCIFYCFCQNLDKPTLFIYIKVAAFLIIVAFPPKRHRFIEWSYTRYFHTNFIFYSQCTFYYKLC